MPKRLYAVLLSFAMVLGLANFTFVEGADLQNHWNLVGLTDVSFEGNSGEWEGLTIDATNGKFSPRASDVQVNAGTIVIVPTIQSNNNLEIVITLSGGSTTVNVEGTSYFSNNYQLVIPVNAEQSGNNVAITFTEQAYLSEIAVNEITPFPGEVEQVDAKDKTWTLTLSSTAIPNLEGNTGEFDGLMLDATNGKFNPGENHTQVNAGTVLYIPVTTDESGVSLTLSGTTDGSTPMDVLVDGEKFQTNQSIPLDVTNTRWVTVNIETSGYMSAIFMDYGSDSGYGVPTVTANDKVWDFSGQNGLNLQGTKGTYDGIQIDALVGKVSSRPETGDTQINAGTVFYLPVASDETIALNIAGNNYNNLTLYFGNEEVNIGQEYFFTCDSPTYIPLQFKSADGNGSAYITSISLDYSSDSDYVNHEVIVGSSSEADYATISEALSNETSSSSTPLIVTIEPGTYEEKLDISQPYVTLRSSTGNAKDVVIQHHYYSSNTYDQDGNYAPVDQYDIGTDQCATILVKSTANNFTISNITVKNTYNTEFKTAEGEQTPAVALSTQADKVTIDQCRVIGRQDTLYVKGQGNRVYVNDSYIEGTVDFIFGDADAFFDNCSLHMAYFTGKDNGYFTAPNTKKGSTGLVFYQCNLTADSRMNEVSLGRPWQNEIYQELVVQGGQNVVESYDEDKPRTGYENVSSSTTFIDCTMTSDIQTARWNLWTRKDTEGNTINVTYEKTVRFMEYNSKDETGSLLSINPEDIVLGKMEVVEDIPTLVSTTLSSMRIGEDSTYWSPNISGGVPDVDVPEEEEPTVPENPNVPEEPTNPDQESPAEEPNNPSTDDPSGNAPNDDESSNVSGTNEGTDQISEEASVTVNETEEVQTGDSTATILIVMLGVSALLTTAIIIRYRLKY